MQIFNEHFWQAIVSSVVFWLISLLMLGFSYLFLDKLVFKTIDFDEELRKGNMAVSLVVSAFLVGIALVIYGVTN